MRNVRPVPPPGFQIDAASRSRLQQSTQELAAAIEALRGRTDARTRLVDVEVFQRAVDIALKYDEFFSAEDVGRAERLLKVGRDRAEALAQGEAPWLRATGPTVLGYRSSIDGTVQPYGVFVPESWSPKVPGRSRLDTWFHGRGETLSELRFIDGALSSGGPFIRPDTFVLQPYGRYNNGSRFAGETDFFESLADLKRRFPIDEDRIVIRGFSLGGATAWHLTAHYAADWAASAPGAGFSETRDFLTGFQGEELHPPWWEEKLWQLYDSPAYVENFRNVPLVAYSGEIDRQKQAADVMAKALGAIGIELRHIIGPNTAHAYHPDAITQINALIDPLAARGRETLPRTITVTTPTLKYNRQAWLQIDALDRHWEKSTVTASLKDGGPITVTTLNSSALTLSFPPGTARQGPPPAVVIDGQPLKTLTLRSDSSWGGSFHREGARWAGGPQPERGLRKRHGLQGPIDDAFMSAFLMVTPSAVSRNPRFETWAQAEMAHSLREWRRQFRGDARVKKDTEVSDADIAANNLVLWGDPISNAVLARIADKLPIGWNAEKITVGKNSYPAEGHALIAIYPNPLNPARYVVLNSGPTYREYDYLNNARQTPKLPDWVVVDLSVPPGFRYPGRVENAGFFGESWELLPSVPATRR